MISVFKQKGRVALAAVALGSMGVSGQVFAAPNGTPSGTTITNTATVNYSVATVAQAPITASTQFLVDTVIKLAVAGGTVQDVTPGQANAFTVFTVTNTSNIASNFNLGGVNLAAGDDFNMNTPGTGTAGVIVRVDSNNNGVYDPGTDNAVSIVGLASGSTATVFVVGDTPAGTPDNKIATVTLTADARDASNAPWVTDTGADTLMGTAQVVVATLSASANDNFHTKTATLAVSKSSSVVSDGLPGPPSANPKAIPGATVEYKITVANTGSTPATLQSVSDTVPANLTFVTGAYPGTRDVSITVGAGPATYCVAEAGGVDSNADGCVRTGTTLSVGAPAITTVVAGSQVDVRFRATIL